MINYNIKMRAFRHGLNGEDVQNLKHYPPEE
jgi:hypothetical protein